MTNSGNLGLAALLTGALDTAAPAFRHELALSRETAARPQAFEGLRGLAALAAVTGDDTRAARLLGAAEAHRSDVPADPVESELERTFFQPARGRVTAEAWTTAEGQGRAMSLDAAIAYAHEAPRV